LKRRLELLLVGHQVRVTHEDTNIADSLGQCVAIHSIPGSPTSFDVEFENGHRFGFEPDTFTENSERRTVEGALGSWIRGRRIFTIL